MKINHVNFIDISGKVYCYKHDQLVLFTPEFYEKACLACPYFVDTANMHGVECFFDDHCNETPEIVFDDSSQSERHSKMVQVRLGLKTEREVDRSLQGFGAEKEKHLEGGEKLPEGTGKGHA